ncbi:Na+/H+ antiporter [Mucilaginibacter xinganensis]|uniref:Sodium/proton antiporter, CPA1 family n=1 Tax=Mucilaginibacter xinganensis TaxID=1234841 RepID=A0A223NRB5_9SPHI|nr:Na+/H+ antiporter [Mucilaginibacter xinganensis]ASU32377.1 sodium/proton antiporter, CPA1 family [Mucilaginibacter xinganensis]
MLQDNLLLILSLLFAVSMLGLLSEKLKISYPILLVISGLIISFIPGVPFIVMDPNMVFIVFLPPLLYAAAWNTSWADFWNLKGPISRLALGLVIFTATGVALIAHFMIPDFTLAMGFLLGGIISPPDAVAASSVLKNLKVPRNVMSILEGESLINDASSLVVFRFALLSVLTGQFVFWRAGVDFILVAGIGILIGIAIAVIVYAIHRFLPTTPSIDTALTLITPYIMYLTAEHFHYSGVLAVVSGGLFLSYRSAEIFAYDSRLQAVTVWTVLTFLLNGTVFILIGLQLPGIIKGIGNYSFSAVIMYAVVISLATIVIRILWVFPGGLFTNFVNRKLKRKTVKLNWKSVFVIAWSGMRGVVSLASALAVPLTLTNGSAFPHRSLILFITFIVILFTLVLQGLTLPFFLRVLKIEEDTNDEQQDLEIRFKLATAVVAYMETACSKEIAELSVFKRVKERYERMAKIADDSLSAGELSSPAFLKTYRQMLLEIIAVRRTELNKMHKNKEYADHLLRAKEQELDFEEARMRK